MKVRRQELIIQAVNTGEISTQEQLLDYLRQQGIDAAQATVSRDVKDLGLKKSVRRDGKVYYEMPSEEEARRGKQHMLLSILSNSVLSVDGAGNIVCVHCAPGMAQGACAALDSMPLEGVVGSLAGEDTIFLLCRGDAEMQAVRLEILSTLEMNS